jgi:hypothetical protein
MVESPIGLSLETAGGCAQRNDETFDPTDPNRPHELGPVLDPATLEELRRLARSRPRSGRQSLAKASAIRTLERLARERRRQPTPAGWYPHEPDHPFLRIGLAG